MTCLPGFDTADVSDDLWSDDWQELQDTTTYKYYYWNKKTQVMKSEKPFTQEEMNNLGDQIARDIASWDLATGEGEVKVNEAVGEVEGFADFDFSKYLVESESESVVGGDAIEKTAFVLNKEYNYNELLKKKLTKPIKPSLLVWDEESGIDSSEWATHEEFFQICKKLHEQETRDGSYSFDFWMWVSGKYKGNTDQCDYFEPEFWKYVLKRTKKSNADIFWKNDWEKAKAEVGEFDYKGAREITRQADINRALRGW